MTALFLSAKVLGRQKEAAYKKGPHFSDAQQSLREKYIMLFSYLQFRAYIAFGELHDDSYPSLYRKLLSGFLRFAVVGVDGDGRRRLR